MLKTFISAHCRKTENNPSRFNQLKGFVRNVKYGHKKQQNLNTGSLVHEAYIKLQNNDKLNIHGTQHFYRLAALAMRQILVDSARAQLRKKRTQEDAAEDEHAFILELNKQVTSSDDILEIDKALTHLEELNPRLADVVVNHFYGGYTFEQIGEMNNISKRTVIRDWNKAKAFIYAQLN